MGELLVLFTPLLVSVISVLFNVVLLLSFPCLFILLIISLIKLEKWRRQVKRHLNQWLEIQASKRNGHITRRFFSGSKLIISHLGMDLKVHCFDSYGARIGLILEAALHLPGHYSFLVYPREERETFIFPAHKDAFSFRHKRIFQTPIYRPAQDVGPFVKICHGPFDENFDVRAKREKVAQYILDQKIQERFLYFRKFNPAVVIFRNIFRLRIEFSEELPESTLDDFIEMGLAFAGKIRNFREEILAPEDRLETIDYQNTLEAYLKPKGNNHE